MSDPLSIAAGVGGLLALTLQVVQINKAYIDSVKNAPKVINAYHRELAMLRSSLALLDDRLSNPVVKDYLTQKHQQSPCTLQNAKDGIDGCSHDLRKTLVSIEKKKNTPSMVNRMTWYFSEGEVEKDLHRLQRYRSMIMDDFNNALSIEHSKHLRDLLVTSEDIEQLSKVMLKDLHLLEENINTIQRTGDRTLASVKSTQKDMARLSYMENGKAALATWVSSNSTIQPLIKRPC
jgi:hypothetical protein